MQSTPILPLPLLARTTPTRPRPTLLDSTPQVRALVVDAELRCSLDEHTVVYINKLDPANGWSRVQPSPKGGWPLAQVCTAVSSRCALQYVVAVHPFSIHGRMSCPVPCPRVGCMIAPCEQRALSGRLPQCCSHPQYCLFPRCVCGPKRGRWRRLLQGETSFTRAPSGG